MEDKSWIALEGECTTHIVDPPLRCRNKSSRLVSVKKSPGAPSRSVQAGGEETIRVRSHDKPISHQVFILVVNAWILSRVAHPLE